MKPFHTMLHFVLRSVARRPGFATVAVVTLALGIGAATAVFSLVDGVLLRPLPYPEPERLVTIRSYWRAPSGYDIPRNPIGSPEYFDYARQNTSMELVAGYSSETVAVLSGDGEPEVVQACTVTASVFPLLGVKAAVGRVLTPEEDVKDGPWAVVLSHRLWQRRFGGDPGVLGRTVDLEIGDEEETVRAQVVGVMPEGFAFPRPGTELWLSLRLDPGRTWRGGHWFTGIGRLRSDVTLADAESEMQALMARWAVDFPDHHVGHGLFLTPMLADTVRNARQTLFFLVGAVALVLLIACANVGGLLLAEGEHRSRELAVRAALGAGTVRLAAQLLAESAVIAGLGGLAGAALAATIIRLVRVLEAGAVPRMAGVAVDGRALLFALGAAALATLLFGLIPALRAAHQDPARTLRAGGRGATAPGSRLRTFLVVAEVTIAVVVTFAAGLLGRSLQAALSVDSGFADRLLAAPLSLPPGRYSPEAAHAFFTELRGRLAALDGVSAAAVASRTPLVVDLSSSKFHIEGREESDGGARPTASSISASPEILTTIGLQLLAGRFIEASDGAGAEPVVVLDETTARRYWPDGDALGARIRFARTDGPWHRVVGVVSDAHWDGLEVPPGSFYHPLAQVPVWAAFHAREATLLLRARRDAGGLVPAVREILREADPALPLQPIDSLEEIAADFAAPRRFLAAFAGGFAAIALGVGAVGVLALLAHETARRRREIGIRLALGAQPAALVRTVVGRGARLAAIGTVLGLVVAIVERRLVAGLLFEVSPADPAAVLLAALAGVLAGISAAAVPAIRAARVDPVTVLRAE